MAGCFTHHSSGPKFTYPPDIQQLCENARMDAKACIESNGQSVKFKRDLTVEKRPGEKAISGEWAWREPVWQGKWVCGLTWDKGRYYLCQIGCNPRTMGDINYGTVKHEIGHYIEMSNRADSGHNVIYKGCFQRWYGLDERGKGKMRTMEAELNGEKVVVDYFLDEDVEDAK